MTCQVCNSERNATDLASVRLLRPMGIANAKLQLRAGTILPLSGYEQPDLRPSRGGGSMEDIPAQAMVLNSPRQRCSCDHAQGLAPPAGCGVVEAASRVGDSQGALAGGDGGVMESTMTEWQTKCKHVDILVAVQANFTSAIHSSISRDRSRSAALNECRAKVEEYVRRMIARFTAGRRHNNCPSKCNVTIAGWVHPGPKPPPKEIPCHMEPQRWRFVNPADGDGSVITAATSRLSLGGRTIGIYFDSIATASVTAGARLRVQCACTTGASLVEVM